MIDLEDKADADKTWTTNKAFFKEIYVKYKRYNKAMVKKIGFKSAANVREKNMICEDIKRDIFEYLSYISRVYQEHIYKMALGK